MPPRRTPPRNPDRVGFRQLMCWRAAITSRGKPMTTREIATHAFPRVATEDIDRKHMQSAWRACRRFLEPVGWHKGQRLWQDRHPGRFLSELRRLTAKQTVKRLILLSKLGLGLHLCRLGCGQPCSARNHCPQRKPTTCGKQTVSPIGIMCRPEMRVIHLSTRHPIGAGYQTVGSLRSITPLQSLATLTRKNCSGDNASF